MVFVDADPKKICGKEIGCHLDPLELKPQHPGETHCQGGFADPGYILQKDMPPGEKGDEKELNDLPIANKYPGDLLQRLFK